MKTATCRRTSRRQKFPFPPLFGLAVLLFSAGLAVGWAGASAVRSAARENSNVPNIVPMAQSTEMPDAPSAQPTDELSLPSAQPTPVPAASSDKPSTGTDWRLVLVNGENPLPESFEVPELTLLQNGHAVDSRAYPSLQQMMDDCRAAGLQPLICSSYRSVDTQWQLFQQEVQNWLTKGCDRAEAEEQAAQWVARPGTSEHHMGLALDIVDLTYQVLDHQQEDTAVQRWLMAHCAEYGFILRYPTDKSELTGVNYEPWHYRYVGEAVAREIMDNGLCLEEYLSR